MSTGSVFTLTVMMINCFDTLCSFYLLNIWIADIFFRGTFLVNEKVWKSSFACYLAFSTMVVFTILSQVGLLYLSFSRYFAVKNPLDQILIFNNTTTFSKFQSFFVVASAAITALLGFRISSVHKYIPMSLCLPFLDPTNSVDTIALFTWFVAVSQLITSSINLVINILLATFLFYHSKVTQLGLNTERSFKSLFIQLFLLSLSNIVCWVPTSILYKSAVFLLRYPIDLVIWATVCVTPINSVVNPVVFILTAVKKVMSKSRRMNRSTSSVKNSTKNFIEGKSE